MSRTGWICDERFLLHDTGYGHPERPDRLRAIDRALRDRGLLDCMTHLPFGPAAPDDVALLHDPDYVRRVRDHCAAGRSHIDCTDSAICSASYDVALLAVGGVMAACDAVIEKRVDNAFCAVRPPGHHAERAESMGFCLFNNVAVAARHVQRKHGVRRVLILDWDVHHGNGTQHSFDDDPTVFYCSIHEHPRYCYPGTGFETETGFGPGAGCTLNLPMMPGASDDEYRAVLEDRFFPAARSFAPDFMLLSAGFDAHKSDPLAGMALSDDGFTWMGRRVIELARDCCGGRLVCVLEGGYDLPALSRNTANLIELLVRADARS